MPANHRVVVNPGSLPFTTYPIRIDTTTNFNVTYSTEIGDRAYGNSGFRIWDTSLIPLSGNKLVSPGSPLIFPYSTAFLPPCYFDSVSTLTVNDRTYIQAFSNSPDNVAGYNSNYFLEQKIVFAINIWNINAFNAPNNRQYTFGGSTQRINGGDDTLYIYFDSPTPAPVDMVLYVRCLTTNGIDRIIPRTYYVTVPASTLKYTTNISLVNAMPQYLTSGGGAYEFYTKDGVITIQVSTADAKYVSALPLYHWGIAN